MARCAETRPFAPRYCPDSVVIHSSELRFRLAKTAHDGSTRSDFLPRENGSSARLFPRNSRLEITQGIQSERYSRSASADWAVRVVALGRLFTSDGRQTGVLSKEVAALRSATALQDASVGFCGVYARCGWVMVSLWYARGARGATRPDAPYLLGVCE